MLVDVGCVVLRNRVRECRRSESKGRVGVVGVVVKYWSNVARSEVYTRSMNDGSPICWCGGPVELQWKPSGVAVGAQWSCSGSPVALQWELGRVDV